jgi:hypothetical protein
VACSILVPVEQLVNSSFSQNKNKNKNKTKQRNHDDPAASDDKVGKDGLWMHTPGPTGRLEGQEGF